MNGLCLCVCICMSVRYVHVCATLDIWKSKDNLRAVSCHLVCPSDHTQVVRLVSRHLCLLRARAHSGYRLGQPETHSVADSAIKLEIPLPQLPGYWDHKRASPHLAHL